MIHLLLLVTAFLECPEKTTLFTLKSLNPDSSVTVKLMEVTMLTLRLNVKHSTFAQLMELEVWPSTASSVLMAHSSTRTTSSVTGGSTLTAPLLRISTLSMMKLLLNVKLLLELLLMLLVLMKHLLNTLNMKLHMTLLMILLLLMKVMLLQLLLLPQPPKLPALTMSMLAMMLWVFMEKKQQKLPLKAISPQLREGEVADLVDADKADEEVLEDEIKEDLPVKEGDSSEDKV